MSSTVNLQALGLNYSPNNLSLPEGSLVRADNVIIRRDNTVESRRGIKDYSNPIENSSNRAKQLIEYKNKIITHINNKLYYDSGNLTNNLADFYAFSGTYTETQDGLRIKSIEANKNLYFTTSEGIKKISAKTAEDFTTDAGFIQNAGAIKALDISAYLDIYQGQKDGFLPQDSTVAYRVVWGYKDRNENLLLGTPSNRYVIYNYLVDSMAMDINSLCINLDAIAQGSCLINDGNYSQTYYTPINSSTSELKTIITGLANKLDNDILLGNTTGIGVPLTIHSFNMDNGGLVTIFFSNGDPTQTTSVNDYINLKNLTNPEAIQISGITAGNPTIFTTSSAHNLTAGNSVLITGTNTFLDSTWEIKEILSSTQLSIQKNSQFNISSVGSGATPTITTIEPHGLSTGNSVIISGSNAITTPVGGIDGTYTVNVTGQYTFTITLTGGKNVTTPGSSAGTVSPNILSGTITPSIGLKELNGKQNITNVFYDNIAITDVISSGTKTIINTGAIAHNFSVGDVVNISVSNISPSINGMHKITAISSYTFDIEVDTSASTIIHPATGYAKKSLINFIYTPTEGNAIEAFNSIISQNATINSYNYTILTETGDNIYSLPLSDINPSIPGTSEQTRIVNNTLLRILDRLKIEKDGIIPTVLKDLYIDSFFLTDSANVKIDITIPTEIINNKDYFYQVYRTRTFTADGAQTLGTVGGNPVEADDEMRLVQEGFPSDFEMLQKSITFLDQSPESLVANNTNLYTNPETGVGILNANEPPPFAKDINTFKNVVFYSNTRTKQKLTNFQLLGLSNISNGDKLTITNSFSSSTYIFTAGVKQQTNIAFTPVTSLYAGSYYILYSAPTNKKYYFWLEVDGIGVAPSVSDGVTIKVPLLSTDTANIVAKKNLNIINMLIYDFFAEENTLPNIKVTNNFEGKVSAPNSGTCPFVVSTIPGYAGNGEDAQSNQILLSSLTSAAQAIEQTSQSLVRIINKKDSIINAFYTSSETTPPGQMILESKTLNEIPFYIISSSINSGKSFSPDISPISPLNNTNIIEITQTSPYTILKTQSPHGLKNGDIIVISNVNDLNNTTIDGYHSVTVPVGSTDTFIIESISSVTLSGLNGVWSKIADTIVSDNEIKPNRIYYSKANEPEAVPLLNYFDISAEDKEILRIYPLRNSLFVFKEDGTHRISGETAPFVRSLLDSSCVVRAPDSVYATNNIIYAWTTKGITPVSEAGASQEVSRPIDTEILRLSSSKFINFKKLTWGVGYDSDSSYTVYTNSEIDDEYATIGFRYCTLTNTWTNVTRSQTCGIINLEEDKMYLGSGIDNIINQERKNFDRTDYSDKDFPTDLFGNSIYLNESKEQVITLPSISEINIGDVITQEQDLSVFLFNNLLKQLDTDPSIIDAGTNTYYNDIKATAGDNMRNKIVQLSERLDLDPAVYYSDYKNRIAYKSLEIIQNYIGSPTTVISGISQIVRFEFYTYQPAPGDWFPSDFGGNYFLLNSPSQEYYFWFDIDGFGTDPALSGGKIGIKLSFDSSVYSLFFDQFISLIADKINASIYPGNAVYNFTGATYNIEVTNNDVGYASHSAATTIPALLNSTVVLQGGGHQLLNGRQIIINGTQSPQSINTINGTHIVSNISNYGLTTSFSVPINVITAGGSGLTFETDINSFQDIKACFNHIIERLNADPGLAYNSYKEIIETTLLEAVIIDINKNKKQITIKSPLDWVVGTLIVYNSINCEIQYAPVTMGDALNVKQIFDTTIMLKDRNITNFIASFSSDLKPEFTEVTFIGEGNGIFGYYTKGFGYGNFGGQSNNAPFRTLIPLQNQRCRYLNYKINHKTAREVFVLYGISLTGNIGISFRGYR